MNLKEIQKIVFEQRPALKSLLDVHGSKTLREYFESQNVGAGPAAINPHKKELLDEFELAVSGVLGQSLASSARWQLDTEYSVSTADHHGSISHAFFLNGNIFQGLHNRSKGYSNILVFSCASISLNNASFPRGQLYTSGGVIKHLPIFSLKYKHHPVYSLRAYNIEEAERLRGGLGKINAKLGETLGNIYGSADVLESRDFSEQIAKTNLALWKLLPEQQDLNLVCISQEELVSRLILTHHLDANQPTEIYNLLFNEEWQEKFTQFFADIPGAFFKDKGTFIFWGIKDGHRVRLKREDGFLVSEDPAVELSIALNAESVAQALDNKSIMPSMALSFITLSFYYGLKCGGGINQIGYLTQMKEAYNKMLEALGVGRQISVSTDYFSGDYGLDLGSGHLLTAIDMLLQTDQKKLAQDIQQNYEQMTLSESVDIMMPEYHKIITGKPHA